MRSSLNVSGRFARLCLISLGVLLSIWWLSQPKRHPARVVSYQRPLSESRPPHPLDDIIRKARDVQNAAIHQATHNLADGVNEYRRRRGRHPPPGFEKWYAEALATDTVIVEEFFDQIYEDLEPFWGVTPSAIRTSLADWPWTLRVRNGEVKNVPQDRFRSRVWGEMIRKVAADLPDMDVAINPYDEPSVFVPWEAIHDLMSKASQQRQRMMDLPAEDMISRPSEGKTAEPGAGQDQDWISEGDLWPYILDTCPPWTRHDTGAEGSASRTTNWTTQKDICANHHWADLHGSLFSPATMHIRTRLAPVFSAAKLQGSNDILLPPPSYYTDDSLFTGKGWFGDGLAAVTWADKVHGLVWRGKATGGDVRGNQDPLSYHRQRLVTALNASDSAALVNDPSFLWPAVAPGSERDGSQLVAWLHDVSDAAFTDLLCESSSCSAMADRYAVAPAVPMKKQYRWKYLPDIDGNSLSGRFRAFLRSNSSPMKATIYKEWHDLRLVPWVHFIPFDITLRDLWYVTAYFLGFGGQKAHDVEGERIAVEGRDWAEKALRREDMLLYTHRVMLEYGRLCDDERDRLGYVDDLLGENV